MRKAELACGYLYMLTLANELILQNTHIPCFVRNIVFYYNRTCSHMHKYWCSKMYFH